MLADWTDDARERDVNRAHFEPPGEKYAEGCKMSKVLFYAMTGEKVCLLHVLMNAVDLMQNGGEAKIVFEGKSVIWPSKLQEERNPLYLKALEGGLIAGVCKACARQFEVHAEVEALGLTLIGDMFGHAPMRPYVDAGYQAVSI